jgi:uncharacterized membrane protein YjdF
VHSTVRGRGLLRSERAQKRIAVAAQVPHTAGMSTPERPLKLLPVIVFNALYMAAAITSSVANGNREFLFYIIVMLVLIGVMILVHRRVRLTQPLLWAFSVWGLLHMAGGLCPLPAGWPYNGEHAVLYSWWLIPDLLKYDQVVHAYGFGITTWLCWHGLSRSVRADDGGPLRPTSGLLLLCAAAGMGFGALNEVVEFIAVLTIPNTNVGGYLNTGWDLVANLAGAGIAAVVLRFLGQRRQD